MSNNGDNVPVRRFSAQQPPQTEETVATAQDEEGTELNIEWDLAALVNFNADIMKKAIHVALQIAEPLKVEAVEFANKHEVMMQIRKDLAMAVFNAAKHDMWKMIEHHAIPLDEIRDYLSAVIAHWEAEIEKQRKEE